MSFTIEIVKSAEKEARNIEKKFLRNIVKSIEELAIEPLPVQSKKLRDSESSYRLRVGQYRVLYKVDNKNKIVTIYHIRHRRNAYR